MLLPLTQYICSSFPVSTTAVWPTSAAQEFTRTALILHLYVDRDHAKTLKVSSGASNSPALVDIKTLFSAQPRSLIQTNRPLMPLFRDVSLSTPISLQPTHAQALPA